MPTPSPAEEDLIPLIQEGRALMHPKSGTECILLRADRSSRSRSGSPWTEELLDVVVIIVGLKPRGMKHSI